MIIVNILITICRRVAGLRGPRVLRQPRLREQPAVLHRAQADQHPAAAPAARTHRLLLREDAVHHRGGQPPEVLQEQRLQRKVRCRLFTGCFVVLEHVK